MTYVDGFVAAVPTANRTAFRDHARAAATVFREPGALAVVECRGDDAPDGAVTSFPQAVNCRPDETVCFSRILWPSRDVRDEAMPKVMSDPRLNGADLPMPFDGTRMIHGGFDARSVPAPRLLPAGPRGWGRRRQECAAATGPR